MVWEIAIEKVLGNEYWINVYHADVVSQAEAKTVGDEIVGVERGVHQIQVGFTKMRVRQVSEIAGPGTVYPIGLPGAVANSIYLPLFVVARVDIAVGTGRPDRKYLKTPFPASLVENGMLTGPAIAFYNSQYCTPLLAIEDISDRSGQPYISAAVSPAVGMRQLRRGSRKRTTPVIA